MQAKRKRNKTGIIIAAATIILVVVLMIFWGKYEAEHKAELSSSLLTTDKLDVLMDEPSERPTEPEKPRRIIPDDPEKILAMAEEAFDDEGYFEPDDILKGFHVYSLLKKCLNCNGDCDKVAEMAKRLKERSAKTYGVWHVERDLLVDLEDSIEKAKQKM